MTTGRSPGREQDAEEGGRSAPVTLGLAAAVAAAAALTYLVFRSAAGRPEIAERVFAGAWAPAVVPPLSRLTGLTAVPVVELLALGYLGWRLFTGGRAGLALIRGGREFPDVASTGAAVLVRDVGVAVILFYALWGFHYSRPPVADRLGLPPVESVTTDELIELSRDLTGAMNASYRALHGTDDAGEPTAIPDDRWAELDAALQRGWERIAADLDLGPLAAARFGPPKPLLLGPLLARLGLTGVYSPFTAEALVVGSTPAVSLALGAVHEQAHQRGITAEGEATFTAFLVALSSGDPLLRYSAAARAQSRVVGLLAQRDPGAARDIMTARLPGVRRDLRDLRAYRLRNRGAASRATRRVNDGYLRANRVPGGVENYDEVTLLLVRYARLEGRPIRPILPSPAAEDARTVGSPEAPSP